MHADIQTYNAAQTPEHQAICEKLAAAIDAKLATAESKIWHGAPVWFLDGNPVVGYSKQKAGIVLLFWSGQSFEEEGLQKEGSFKAAQKVYTEVSQIKLTELKRWLTQAKTIQWDYKNIVKRRGKLERIE